VALLRSLATLLFVLSIPVALVTLNVRYAFNEPRLWDHGFDRYRSDLRAGLDRSEIDRSAARLMAYFNDDTEEFRVTVVDDGAVEPLFSDQEVQHLVDVKDLVTGVYKLQAAALAFALVYAVSLFVWAREMPVRSLARRLFFASVATIVLLGAFGAVAATGFDSVWRQFHVISFSNDLWQLNPATDRLIQMFPTPFWQDATYFVGFLTIVEALFIGAVSAIYLGATRSHGRRDFDDGVPAEIPVRASEGAGT
jgi:integral membrane protein (TIGR01906 family)